MNKPDLTQEEKEYWCAVAGHVWKRNIIQEPSDFCYCCDTPSNRKEILGFLTESGFFDSMHSTSQDKPEQTS